MTIAGGFILLARKYLEGEIMEKPPLYSKLWLWMLLQANWKDTKHVKRGQLLCRYDDMVEAMSWMVGARIEKPTFEQVRQACRWFKAEGMVDIHKTTRGMIITVCNYEVYQDPTSYHSDISRKPVEPQSNHIRNPTPNPIPNPTHEMDTSEEYEKTFSEGCDAESHTELHAEAHAENGMNPSRTPCDMEIIGKNTLAGTHTSSDKHTNSQDHRTNTASGDAARVRDGFKDPRLQRIFKEQGEEAWIGTRKRGGRKLHGLRLAAFKLFWETFDFKHGRAEAIDAWLDIDKLTEAKVLQIIKAAEIEAGSRHEIIAQGRTPKWAQGWLNSRRWEDEGYFEESQSQQEDPFADWRRDQEVTQ